MSRALFGALAILAAVTGSTLRSRASEPGERGGPVGYWLTQSRHGVIEVSRCGNALCGRIVGIGRAPNAPVPTDSRGRSQCGLMILRGDAQAPDGTWSGSITDPRNGTTYSAQLWMDRDDRLHVRGYLGLALLGQTQTWTRYTGRWSNGCRMD